MKDCPELQALCDFLKDRHAMEDDCFYELLERIRKIYRHAICHVKRVQYSGDILRTTIKSMGI